MRAIHVDFEASFGQKALTLFMKLSEFDYELPPALIAAEPLTQRDASRLLVINRSDQSLSHAHFGDLRQLLTAGDLLVLNNTEVLRARLLGHKESGGRVELLLTDCPQSGVQGEAFIFEALVRTSKALKVGAQVIIADDLKLTVHAAKGQGFYQFAIHEPSKTHTQIAATLQMHGHIPLPPYLQREDTPADEVRYQTVFAQTLGSSAAPTAGLHFTHELLGDLRRQGVETAFVTLHVGAGTFLPVREEAQEDILQHRMHEERYIVEEAAARAIQRALDEGRRVIPVGTTAMRTIETVMRSEGKMCASSGRTSLYITPGFQFRAAKGLITNFHLPHSTLLILASAFTGHDLLMRAYQTAVQENYRFFSYGDACLIL